MFLLPRLQQNFDAKDGYHLTLSSTRKDTHAGVYSGSKGILTEVFIMPVLSIGLVSINRGFNRYLR